MGGIKKKFPNRKKYLLDKLIEYIDKTLFEHVNFKNIIISGMASSSIGIQELDYSKIPFNFIKPKNKFTRDLNGDKKLFI